MKRILASGSGLLVWVGLVLFGLSPPSVHPSAAPAASPATIQINAAGATFPYPIYSKWFDVYHNLRPDIQINYQSIGSGGGIRQVMAGTVDFGGSDGPMTDSQLAEAQSKMGCDVLDFPTVLGADGPTYNISGGPGGAEVPPEGLPGGFF